MTHRFLPFLLAPALALSLMGVQPVTVQAETSSSAKILPGENIPLEEGTYEDGQVIVTIAAPGKTPLTKEGAASFDGHITIEDSWNFGDADVLAQNQAEKDFMEDKSLYVTKVSSDTYSTSMLMSELDDQAYVVSVEPDYYQEKRSVTNDPLSDYQWYLDGTNVTGEGIHYSSLNQNSSSTAPVVAIVDTGVDYTHEDLSSHMWKNTYSSLDGTYGYDFGDGDTDPMDQDEDGHGTHCAGIIAASSNNKTGISGISSNAKIMALKVFQSNGSAYNSAVIGAFNYIYEAQQLGVNIAVVNCSWGGGTSSTTMKTLIQKIGESGAVFVFAAGNDGLNHDASSVNECPYDLDSPYVVTVGASDLTDSKAAYSDYGASSVDLFAPGSRILSTIPQPIFYPALLPASQRNSICSYYSSCDSLDTSLYRTSGTLNVTSISQSAENSLTDSPSGSYQLSISSSSRSSTLNLYMDVTDLGLSPFNSYYVSCDIGMDSDGMGIEWEHNSFERTAEAFTTSGDRQYIRILTLSGNFRSVPALYLDNVSISMPNLPTSSLLKYNVYSGTSMAAPSVSAAVAILASAYPKDSAVQRRERLLTCVRKTSGLANYCRTGGILDLSKVPSAVYTTQTTSTSTSQKVKVTKVTLNKKKATLRYKSKLKLKATIKPTNATNKKVKWTVSKKKYATVTQKGVVKAKKKGIGHTVKVYATAKDGSGKKATCKVTIKKKK